MTRKEKKGFAILLVGLMVLCVQLFTTNCLAQTFNLTYTLTEGGYRLEITPENPYKGVQLQVTSDVSVQYEIIQRVIDPLRCKDNPNITITNNFVVRSLRGTNRYGDLRLPSSNTPVRSDDIFYVSDTNGDADSFTLVYGLNNLEQIPAGEYLGRISFTLRPITSGLSPVTQILEVYVKIEEKEAKPIIEMSTSMGTKNIILSTKKDETKNVQIIVKNKGGLKSLFSLMQYLPRPLESEGGVQLPYEAINFSVSDVEKGLANNQLTPLSFRPQIVYTSEPNGAADEEFVITYGLGDLSGIKAGRYRSSLQYYVEETAKPRTNLDTFDLDVEIERMFDIDVKTELESGKMEFRDMEIGGISKTFEIVIEVKSNTGKPYQVTQRIPHELVTKEGTIAPEETFTLKTVKVDEPETKGSLKIGETSAVKTGETILFLSDKAGSSDIFKVIYEFKPTSRIRPADYSTSVSYAIAEL